MARSLVTLSSLRLFKLNPTRALYLAAFVAAALLYAAFLNLGIYQHFRESGDDGGNDDLMLLENQLSMLSTAQLARYRGIADGTVTRKDVEIVLSRHHEDVRWSDMYGRLRTVYDKPTNDSYALAHTQGQEAALGRVVRLPNLGRESYTYLWHIVHNYDNLARLTVFSHGSAPSHGYLGHRRGGGHLLCNSTFHDFVLSESAEGHFIFTGAVWLPTLSHVLRAGYNKEVASRTQALSTCPTPSLSQDGGSEYRFDLDDKPHMHLLQHVASLCAAENSTSCSGLASWHSLVQLPRPPEDMAFFSQGAVFAATARQIRQRSRASYQALLHEVSRSEDPSAGFFLEWFWFYIVTSEIAPCSVDGKEFGWAKVRPFYKSLPLQERVLYTEQVVAALSKKRKRNRGKGRGRRARTR